MIVVHWDRKIPTLGYTVQWETRQASFPTGTVGPWFGIFLSLLNINDGFYLSHIPVPAHGKDKKRKGPIASKGRIYLCFSENLFPLVIFQGGGVGFKPSGSAHGAK